VVGEVFKGQPHAGNNLIVGEIQTEVMDTCLVRRGKEEKG
jgi:hypothetical protein